MPMLDEEEFQSLISRRDPAEYSDGFPSLLREYERITGFHETNPNAVYHHRLSLYGRPCKVCGKPLRTPKAKLCVSCMAPISN